MNSQKLVPEKTVPPSLASLSQNGLSERRAEIGFFAFLAMAFLMGGGSRADIDSLGVLRFLSACAVGYAILTIARDDMARIKLPLALLAAIAAIGIIQLVPLPPEAWTSLPERAAIARLDALIGLDARRPITLSPSATLNTIFSLIVPLAGLLLFAAARNVDRALTGFVVLGTISALLGILQVFSDPRSGLYFYEITNNGSAVGLFANRNHQAVFLSCCVLICSYLATSRELGAGRSYVWLIWSAAGLMGLCVLINGSRAGLMALIMVTLMSALALALRKPRGDKDTGRGFARWAMPAALLTIAGLVLGLFAAAQRIPALARLLEDSALEDLRAKLLPILVEMAGDFQPWGTGLGAFEHAYRMREPIELLGPAYVNEAHNDWLQIVIEGGVPAILIMGLSAVIVAWRAVALLKQKPLYFEARSWLGLGLLAVLGIASLVDYPLRVPSMMVLGIIALAIFLHPALNKERDRTPV
ncbi:MAG: O-antigen ligase family protein [Erythrobacter sp.]|nr:O-antigen ligase family protein [Erythrobacter sp.]